jgi:hypothetical protein
MREVKPETVGEARGMTGAQHFRIFLVFIYFCTGVATELRTSLIVEMRQVPMWMSLINTSMGSFSDRPL